jgi:hypothetical protein
MIMNQARITTTMALLMLAATVIRADVLEEPKGPPAEKTLTGKLTWTYFTKADGTQKKSWLKLQAAGAADVNLGPAGGLSVPATLDVETFVGKNVTVTVMAQEAKSRGRTVRVLVKSIKDIKELPSTNARENVPAVASSAKPDPGASPAKP